MCGVAPAARPGVAIPRRDAPVRSAAAPGVRAIGTNKPRGVVPASRGLMARDSSACRAGAGGFCATEKKILNAVQVEVEVIPVGVKKPVNSAPGHLRGALARDPSVCLAAVAVISVPSRKRTKRTRNTGEAKAEVLTVGGKTPVDPALDLLHKRMASELQALREILKKAELISRGSACKGGAPPAAGKSKRLLAAEQRVEAGDKAPSAKRRKVSPVPERKQTKVPRMSPDEREQLAGRLASLPELPGHFVEFLQQQFGEDPHGEIEIDIHKVEDSVLFELKARLDKLDEEHLSEDALPKEQHNNSSVMMELDSKTQMDKDVAEETIAPAEQEEEDVDICGASDSDSGSSSSSDSDDSDGSSSSSDSDSESDSDDGEDSPAPPAVLPQKNGASAQAPPVPAPEANVAKPAERQVAQSAEPKKAEDVGQQAAPKAVCVASVILRAKLRRELLEMERAVLPDESIHAMDLRRLCIAEYGRPGIMRQLGLVLKADA